MGSSHGKSETSIQRALQQAPQVPPLLYNSGFVIETGDEEVDTDYRSHEYKYSTRLGSNTIHVMDTPALDRLWAGTPPTEMASPEKKLFDFVRTDEWGFVEKNSKEVYRTSLNPMRFDFGTSCKRFELAFENAAVEDGPGWQYCLKEGNSLEEQCKHETAELRRYWQHLDRNGAIGTSKYSQRTLLLSNKSYRRTY